MRLAKPKKFCKHSGLLIIFCLSFIPGHSQSSTDLLKTVTQQVVPSSPEAAGIMLYQTYPTDYVSGAPQISIPLFTAKAGSRDIPFTLDYQVGKVKPSVLSGIAGTGWTISPDLGITRSIQGEEDKLNSGYPANNQLGSTTSAYLLSAARGNLDEQPDDFFYSLLSKSGSFVYKQNTGFVPLSYQPVKISHPDDNSFIITDDDGTSYLFGKYSTGSSTQTEFTNENNNQIDITTCWKITEIISYNKSDTIRFCYNQARYNQIIPYFNAQWKVIEYPDYMDAAHLKEPEVYRTNASLQEPSTLEGHAGHEVLKPGFKINSFSGLSGFDLMLTEEPGASDAKMIPDRTLISQASINQKAVWTHSGNYGASYSEGSEVKLNYVKQLRLDSISFREGGVVLSYDANNQLTTILYRLAGRQIKQIILKQHQVQSQSVAPPFITSSLYNNYCKRFFLDSLTIKGMDSNAPGLKYGFTYNTDDLGVYSNYNTDYWDYRKSYRGDQIVPRMPYQIGSYRWFTGSPTADPNDSTTGSNGVTPIWMALGDYQEETTQSYQALFGLISTISYPTGGKARFEFEQNRYESFVVPDKIVYGGGVRIKTIHYITSQGQDSLIKKYTYGTSNENGYGVTKNQQSDYNFIYQQYINTTGLNQPLDTFKKITYLNSKPFLNNAYSNGAAVLYPEVTEYSLSGKNNQPLGKTVYNYNINPNTVSAGIAMTPLIADTRDAWRNIKFQSVTSYRYDGGSYIPEKSKHFEYSAFITNQVPAAGTYLNWYTPVESQLLNDVPPITGVDKFPHVSYNILCGGLKLTKETDTSFDNQNSAQKIITVTDYQYETQHLQPSGSKTVDSRGFTQVRHYWYPFQSSVPGYTGTQTTMLSTLASGNRIGAPIAQKDSTDGVLMHTARQEFRYLGAYPLPGAVYFSHRTGAEYKKTEVLSYDNYGHITEQKGDDGIVTTIIWGYDGLYPVAKIIGSSYAAAFALLNEASLKNSQISDANMRNALNALRTGLPGAQIWTYTYLPGIGVTSECGPDGTLIFYTYDGLGRLISIKDDEGNILETHRYHYVNQ